MGFLLPERALFPTQRGVLKLNSGNRVKAGVDFSEQITRVRGKNPSEQNLIHLRRPPFDFV